MGGEILIGTSGWNYPAGGGTWNGVFYPKPRPRGFDELAYYATHFDTVEINSTFYRMPEAPMTQRWVERTPPGFLFSAKLFQKFTHPDLYLAKGGAAEWDVSRADIDLFGIGIDPIRRAGRLAAVLVQFPPSFHATPETRDYLDWLLGAFHQFPLAVELRHRSWSDETPETEARLAATNACWAFIDEPKFESSVRQSIAQDSGSHTAGAQIKNDSRSLRTGSPGIVYIRLHGRNRQTWWEHDHAEDRYNYLYSPEELQPFAHAAQDAASHGRRVLLYMNNHFSAKAVANAAVLKHQLGQLVPGDYPREMVARYPDLAGIVSNS